MPRTSKQKAGLEVPEDMKGKSWHELKLAGNNNFENGKYADAVKLYSVVIARLENRKGKDSKELARVYSNRSVSYLKLGLEEFQLKALRDAKQTIKYDEQWARGYYRCVAACHSMSKFDEAAEYMKQLLEISQWKIIPDNVQELMCAIHYHKSRIFLEGRESYKIARYKNCFVIDASGAGDFSCMIDAMEHLEKMAENDDQHAFELEVSFIMMPGVYECFDCRLDFLEQNIQIIGDGQGVKFIGGPQYDGFGVIMNSDYLELYNINISPMPQEISEIDSHTAMCDPFANYCIINHDGVMKMFGCTVTEPKGLAAIVIGGQCELYMTNCQVYNSHAGIFYSESEDSCKVELLNCRFENIDAIGISILGDSNSLLMERCVFENCGEQGVLARGVNTKLNIQNSKLLKCAKKYYDHNIPLSVLTMYPSRACCVLAFGEAKLYMKNCVLETAHPKGSVCVQVYSGGSLSMDHCKTGGAQYGIISCLPSQVIINRSYLVGLNCSLLMIAADTHNDHFQLINNGFSGRVNLVDRSPLPLVDKNNDRLDYHRVINSSIDWRPLRRMVRDMPKAKPRACRHDLPDTVFGVGRGWCNWCAASLTSKMCTGCSAFFMCQDCVSNLTATYSSGQRHHATSHTLVCKMWRKNRIGRV